MREDFEKQPCAAYPDILAVQHCLVDQAVLAGQVAPVVPEILVVPMVLVDLEVQNHLMVPMALADLEVLYHPTVLTVLKVLVDLMFLAVQLVLVVQMVQLVEMDCVVVVEVALLSVK